METALGQQVWAEAEILHCCLGQTHVSRQKEGWDAHEYYSDHKA